VRAGGGVAVSCRPLTNDHKESPSRVHELWDRVKKKWTEISKEVVQNLIASMLRRCAAVIKAERGHTQY